MAAHQAPPSLGLSRQEYWSGLPFPSPMHTVKSQSEVAQSCPTLSDLMDCSPPGSSVHGIFQARVLEWGAIAFSVYLFNGILFTHCEVQKGRFRSDFFQQCDTDPQLPGTDSGPVTCSWNNVHGISQ